MIIYSHHSVSGAINAIIAIAFRFEAKIQFKIKTNGINASPQSRGPYFFGGRQFEKKRNMNG
jgi:hypothetical protein